jgi:thiamine-phosphate pyrophosphorylase
MRAADINIPIVAIGGITEDDIPAILATGITGIALSGTVLRADNPAQKMKNILNIINHE